MYISSHAFKQDSSNNARYNNRRAEVRAVGHARRIEREKFDSHTIAEEIRRVIYVSEFSIRMRRQMYIPRGINTRAVQPHLRITHMRACTHACKITELRTRFPPIRPTGICARISILFRKCAGLIAVTSYSRNKCSRATRSQCNARCVFIRARQMHIAPGIVPCE